MSPASEYAKEEPLPDRVSQGNFVSFVALAFLLTWTAAALFGWVESSDQGATEPWLRTASYLGVWAPSLAGFAVVWFSEGTSAAKHLLARLWRWPGHWYWYAIAFLLPPVIYLIAAVIGSQFGSYPLRRAVTIDWTRALIFFATTLVAGPLGEEFGWRGYALPRMAQRYSPALAAVSISLLWSLWHLPAFVVPGLQSLIFPTGISFWQLAGVTTGGGIISAWLTFRSRYALGPAVLFHLGLLTCLLAVQQTPPPVLTWTSVALYLTLGVAILVLDRHFGQNSTAADR